jgi:transcriptional regulator of acetoin/glycerol metabolism
VLGGLPPAAAGTSEVVEQKLAEVSTASAGASRRTLISDGQWSPLRAVLRETAGTSCAAALLGINRNTLRQKLRSRSRPAP